MCDKVPHESKQAARQVARGMSQEYRQSMGAYWCHSCDCWHVSTKGKTKLRRDNSKYPFRFHGKVKKQKVNRKR